MSIFRPVNSDESNLFHIRCLVSFIETSYQFGTSISNVNIAGGTFTQESSLATFTNLMRTPTTNNLPTHFAIYVDNTNKCFFLNYGKEFVKSPTVHITPLVHNIDTSSNTVDRTTTGIVIPQIDINSNTHYEKSSTDTYKTLNSTAIAAGAYNVKFEFFNMIIASGSSSIALADHSKMYGFCVDIFGPVKMGITTGNSNRGWGVGTGINPGNVYSYMNIGIGTGNPTKGSSLTVRGSVDAPFKYSPKSTSAGAIASTAQTLVSTRGNAACMYDDFVTVSHNADVTLTARTAEEVANDLISLFNFEPKESTYFDLTVINTMTGNTVTMAAPSDVGGPPSSTHTEVGNMVVAAESSGTFRFFFTTVTLGLYNAVYVYQIIRIY